MPSKGTLVLGVIGADIHNIGITILATALTDAGFKVVSLGILVSQEEFVKAAVETAADAILVSSLCGHGELDCPGLRDKCLEAGLENIVLYAGGNLVVGKKDWEPVAASSPRWATTARIRPAPPPTRDRGLDGISAGWRRAHDTDQRSSNNGALGRGPFSAHPARRARKLADRRRGRSRRGRRIPQGHGGDEEHGVEAASGAPRERRWCSRAPASPTSSNTSRCCNGCAARVRICCRPPLIRTRANAATTTPSAASRKAGKRALAFKCFPAVNYGVRRLPPHRRGGRSLFARTAARTAASPTRSCTPAATPRAPPVPSSSRSAMPRTIRWRGRSSPGNTRIA